MINHLNPKSVTAKQLASILALKSAEIFFPATKAVSSEFILETGERLSDHLPIFWSSMLKLSKELKTLTKECEKPSDIINEGKEFADTLIEFIENYGIGLAMQEAEGEKRYDKEDALRFLDDEN